MARFRIRPTVGVRRPLFRVLPMGLGNHFRGALATFVIGAGAVSYGVHPQCSTTACAAAVQPFGQVWQGKSKPSDVR